MNAATVNLILNILGVLLGGGAIAAYLRYRVQMRRLGNSNEADIRDHYADEVKRLHDKLDQQENHFKGLEKHWREVLEQSDRRHEECEQSRRLLRIELDKMHDELTGLRRQIARYSAKVALDIGAPPEVVEAAKRIEENGK